MAQMVMDHKRVLNQLGDLIAREKDCLVKIYADSDTLKSKLDELEITKSKTGEAFVVLVIGAFSSGKSTMINAMIGEELLPTGFLPETAVLGELHYGDQKRITLYPRKGMWEGGDQPFDLPKADAAEIAKYTSLSADDAINAMEEDSEKRIASKFEKMVVHWPLDILKDGVVLVDSPGINDPYSSEYIVNDFLPHADAIIYVMDSQHAYQGTDAEQLDIINSRGLENIITGYTFYDVVTHGVKDNSEKLEKVRNRLVDYAKKHSNLGKEAVHFLSSVEALEAKQSSDEAKLRRSGFEGMEEYLSRYLVEGKGKDQVKNMASTIIAQGNAMNKDIEKFDIAAAQDSAKLKERAEAAKQELESIRRNSYNTGEKFQLKLDAYLPKVREMTEEFLKALPQNVDLEGFEPETTLPEGVGNLNPFAQNKKAKAIQKECQEELQRRMNNLCQTWKAQTLSPYLKQAIQDSAQEIRPDLQQIARDLNDTIDGVMTGQVSGAGTDVAGNIAVGLAYALMTGDWFTGGMSVVYGKGAMVRGVAFQAAAGVALGLLMAAGVTISFPVVVIASIGASIAAIVTGNNDNKVEKIKKQAVSALRESYSTDEAKKSVETNAAAIVSDVSDYLNSASQDMKDALSKDIKETEDSINQMIKESQNGEEEKRRQVKERAQVTEALKSIRQKTLDICTNYGITVSQLRVGAK